MALVAPFVVDRGGASQGQVTRVALALSPPAVLGFDTADPELALSPDGSHLVYLGYAEARQRALFVRALDEGESRLVDGIGGQFPRTPFVSADGLSLG